jgi:hypothetical protein
MVTSFGKFEAAAYRRAGRAACGQAWDGCVPRPSRSVAANRRILRLCGLPAGMPGMATAVGCPLATVFFKGKAACTGCGGRRGRPGNGPASCSTWPGSRVVRSAIANWSTRPTTSSPRLLSTAFTSINPAAQPILGLRTVRIDWRGPPRFMSSCGHASAMARRGPQGEAGVRQGSPAVPYTQQ